ELARAQPAGLERFRDPVDQRPDHELERLGVLERRLQRRALLDARRRPPGRDGARVDAPGQVVQPDRLDPELTAEGDPRDAAQITEGAQAEEVEVAALILVERQALDRERL